MNPVHSKRVTVYGVGPYTVLSGAETFIGNHDL
jgi:hypothetical protein